MSGFGKEWHLGHLSAKIQLYREENVIFAALSSRLLTFIYLIAPLRLYPRTYTTLVRVFSPNVSYPSIRTGLGLRNNDFCV